MFKVLQYWLYVVQSVYAEDPNSFYCTTFFGEGEDGACGEGVNFIVHIADFATATLYYIIGPVAVFALVWGFSQLITSGIDEQGKETAKKTVTLVLLGLIWAVTGGAILVWLAGYLRSVLY